MIDKWMVIKCFMLDVWGRWPRRRGNTTHIIKTLLSRIDSCSVPGIYIKISPYHYFHGLISCIEPHRFSYLQFSKQRLATIEENAKRSERRMRALNMLTKGPHFVSTSKRNTST